MSHNKTFHTLFSNNHSPLFIYGGFSCILAMYDSVAKDIFVLSSSTLKNESKIKTDFGESASIQNPCCLEMRLHQLCHYL